MEVSSSDRGSVEGAPFSPSNSHSQKVVPRWGHSFRASSDFEVVTILHLSFSHRL